MDLLLDLIQYFQTVPPQMIFYASKTVPLLPECYFYCCHCHRH